MGRGKRKNGYDNRFRSKQKPSKQQQLDKRKRSNLKKTAKVSRKSYYPKIGLKLFSDFDFEILDDVLETLPIRKREDE